MSGSAGSSALVRSGDRFWLEPQIAVWLRWLTGADRDHRMTALFEEAEKRVLVSDTSNCASRWTVL